MNRRADNQVCRPGFQRAKQDKIAYAPVNERKIECLCLLMKLLNFARSYPLPKKSSRKRRCQRSALNSLLQQQNHARTLAEKAGSWSLSERLYWPRESVAFLLPKSRANTALHRITFIRSRNFEWIGLACTPPRERRRRSAGRRRSGGICRAFLVVPDFVVDADLAASALAEVIPQWRPRTGIVHAVFLWRRGLLPAIRGQTSKPTAQPGAVCQTEYQLVSCLLNIDYYWFAIDLHDGGLRWRGRSSGLRRNQR